MSFPVFSFQQVGYRGLYKPTVVVDSKCQYDNEASRLMKAMKGIGTNEKELIDVLGRRPSFQRAEIRESFLRQARNPLLAEIKSETSGEFMKLLQMLVRDLAYVEASGVYFAMKGLGTRERRLNQIMIGKSNAELEAITEAYQLVLGDHKQDANRVLLDDIRAETSRSYEQLLVNMWRGMRQELGPSDLKVAIERGAMSVLDPRQVALDVEALYTVTVGQQGADENIVAEILSVRSYLHLQAVFTRYFETHGTSFYDVMSDELTGDFRDACLDIYEFCCERELYFARLLRCTTRGLGTRDGDLMRLVVTRSEIDLGSIMEAYDSEYGQTLVKAIEGDTSGDYSKLLLALCGQKPLK